MLRSILGFVSMPRLGTSRFILLWAGLAIHLLTVYTALRLDGWLEAGLSLFFPFAAQVYWIVDIWQRTGNFWHSLTNICLVYAAAWFIAGCLQRR
jgi:hypothetical protein